MGVYYSADQYRRFCPINTAGPSTRSSTQNSGMKCAGGVPRLTVSRAPYCTAKDSTARAQYVNNLGIITGNDTEDTRKQRPQAPSATSYWTRSSYLPDRSGIPVLQENLPLVIRREALESWKANVRSLQRCGRRGIRLRHDPTHCASCGR